MLLNGRMHHGQRLIAIGSCVAPPATPARAALSAKYQRILIKRPLSADSVAARQMHNLRPAARTRCVSSISMETRLRCFAELDSTLHRLPFLRHVWKSEGCTGLRWPIKRVHPVPAAHCDVVLRRLRQKAAAKTVQQGRVGQCKEMQA